MSFPIINHNAHTHISSAGEKKSLMVKGKKWQDNRLSTYCNLSVSPPHIIFSHLTSLLWDSNRLSKYFNLCVPHITLHRSDPTTGALVQEEMSIPDSENIGMLQAVGKLLELHFMLLQVSMSPPPVLIVRMLQHWQVVWASFHTYSSYLNCQIWTFQGFGTFCHTLV